MLMVHNGRQRSAWDKRCVIRHPECWLDCWLPHNRTHYHASTAHPSSTWCFLGAGCACLGSESLAISSYGCFKAHATACSPLEHELLLLLQADDALLDRVLNHEAGHSDARDVDRQGDGQQGRKPDREGEGGSERGSEVSAMHNTVKKTGHHFTRQRQGSQMKDSREMSRKCVLQCDGLYLTGLRYSVRRLKQGGHSLDGLVLPKPVDAVLCLLLHGRVPPGVHEEHLAGTGMA